MTDAHLVKQPPPAGHRHQRGRAGLIGSTTTIISARPGVPPITSLYMRRCRRHTGV